MQSIDRITAITGQGLGSDRYAQQQGYYHSVDACEVTLITQADIERASRRASAPIRQALAAGGHRRNLVITGLNVERLAGSSFAIGEAVFRYRKPRPPCAYLDRVSGKGMCKALGKHSGACIEVVSGGLLSVGDRVRVIP
jgi:MOSC domain-containing protein YiiM